MSFDSYYNEMYLSDGSVRSHYRPLAEWIAGTPAEHILQMRQAAHLLFHRVGITFAVYGEEAGAERLIPFDMLPHIIPAAEWRDIANGLRQRAKALNAFLHDIYHGQEILKAGKVPRQQVLENRQYRPEMVGIDVPGGIYAHIAGIDLVRAGAGEYYVLEDNLRTPSGVSYMLENRKMMMRLVPELFARQSIAPVEHYPGHAAGKPAQRGARPASRIPPWWCSRPGQFNSAYFEHAFLAQQMGIELVEGADLFVRDDSGVHAHDQRAAAGGRDLPPHRRRFHRSAGVSRRFHARRARPGERISQGQGDARQRHRHRRGRRQVDLSLRPGDDPLLSRRGTAAQQRAHVPVAPPGGSRLRAGTIWRNWW